MTLIKLGSIGLHLGMSRAEAEYNDEQIKKVNHGKTPVDKNGKELQSNVSLFTQYDTDNNGLISESEYQNYRQDMAKKFEDMINSTKEEIKKTMEDFRNGNSQKDDKSKMYYIL